MAWAMVSALCHATVCPTRTDTLLGAKDMLPLIPLMVMTTFVGGGGCDGDVGEESLPQPTRAATSASAKVMRRVVLILEFMRIHLLQDRRKGLASANSVTSVTTGDHCKGRHQ